MSRADLLIELGTEELPPKALPALRDAFRDGLVTGLAGARLAHGEVHAFATPRRLALLVHDLELAQPDRQVEHRGPPVRLGFDSEGMPTRAAIAFAQKCGVNVEQLGTVSTDKGEWLVCLVDERGAATSELLAGLVERALGDLPIPRRMRWGSSDVEFVRPVHWLVLLLGDTVVPGTVLGLPAGRETRGHRFHHPEPIAIKQPRDYADLLRATGHVLADFDERRRTIAAAARETAAALGGEAIMSTAILDEVTALVEWPVAVAGRFDAGFLRLPPEVLTATLQDHQRYFPVRNTTGLMPAFITISNIDSADPSAVRRGNERVVVPRLSDAAFFWDKDSKTRLEARQNALHEVVYQQGLGSLHDKSQRVSTLATAIAGLLQADVTKVARAAALARTDLLTDIVGEFPELQGCMGGYYARQDGEPEAVAMAIEEFYLPRHAGDSLPATATGHALAIADRLDTLAGIFSLGKKPSGNKDPFGLRRQALGLVRLLIEGRVDADLPALLSQAVRLQPVGDAQSAAGVAAEVLSFVQERMRAWYLEGLAPDISAGDISPELFEAVKLRAPASLLDFHQRLIAVRQFMQHPAAISLAAANKRIANILRQAGGSAMAKVQPSLFESAAEEQLHAMVEASLQAHAEDLAARNYASLLGRLAGLRETVDRYFDEVMVLCDDQARRANRLAQLAQLRHLFLDVADLSSIPTA